MFRPAKANTVKEFIEYLYKKWAEINKREDEEYFAKIKSTSSSKKSTDIIDTVIKKLHTKINENMLFGGNCGMFALGLHRSLAKINIETKFGVLFKDNGAGYNTAKNILDDETDIYHVFLIHNNKFYDGQGKVTKNNIIKIADEYDDDNPGSLLNLDLDRFLLSLIDNETDWRITSSKFEKLLDAQIKRSRLT